MISIWIFDGIQPKLVGSPPSFGPSFVSVDLTGSQGLLSVKLQKSDVDLPKSDIDLPKTDVRDEVGLGELVTKSLEAKHGFKILP